LADGFVSVLLLSRFAPAIPFAASPVNLVQKTAAPIW
jgi:hypothetical protein